MRLRFQAVQKVGLWWKSRRKWFIRLFWLNIIIWFWPLYWGNQTYKELIVPREIASAQYERTAVTYEAMPTEVREFVKFYADRYGISMASVEALINCESQWKTEIVGDTDKKYYSYGLFQWQPVSFYEWSGKFGFRNMDIKDWRDQTIVAMEVLRSGHSEIWTCANNLKLKF